MNTSTTGAHLGAADVFREEAIPFVIYNPELRSKYLLKRSLRRDGLLKSEGRLSTI